VPVSPDGRRPNRRAEANQFATHKYGQATSIVGAKSYGVQTGLDCESYFRDGSASCSEIFLMLVPQEYRLNSTSAYSDTSSPGKDMAPSPAREQLRLSPWYWDVGLNTSKSAFEELVQQCWQLTASSYQFPVGKSFSAPLVPEFQDDMLAVWTESTRLKQF